MDWLALIKALAPVAISIAETVHPMSGEGQKKLQTATTIIQAGLAVVAETGAIPPAAVDDVNSITAAINQSVAAANSGTGVPKVK